jgi:DNA-binding GntR family transcriptional regulator
MSADPLANVSIGPELQTRRTTSDYIADALRRAILMGEISDGAVLNQVATAERFGVSRVPVREAMRRLQAEGLISAEAHRQPVVRSLSMESIAEICELRALIEQYLTERAIEKVDDALIAHLEALLDAMDHAADHQEWLRLNSEFHTAIYRAAGLPTALEMAETLRGRVERYLNLWSHGQGVDRSVEAGNEHRLILMLIRNGNVAGAREEVRRHVMGTLARIRQLYGQQSTTVKEI